MKYPAIRLPAWSLKPSPKEMLQVKAIKMHFMKPLKQLCKQSLAQDKQWYITAGGLAGRLISSVTWSMLSSVTCVCTNQSIRVENWWVSQIFRNCFQGFCTLLKSTFFKKFQSRTSSDVSQNYLVTLGQAESMCSQTTWCLWLWGKENVAMSSEGEVRRQFFKSTCWKAHRQTGRSVPGQTTQWPATESHTQKKKKWSFLNFLDSNWEVWNKCTPPRRLATASEGHRSSLICLALPCPANLLPGKF